MKAYQKLITKKLIEFRNKRKWIKFHTPVNLANAIIVEAAELNELFQWGKTPTKERLKEEIADVLIFVLYLCQKYNFDIWDIIQEKINKNEIKYPVDLDCEKEKGWKS